MQVDPISPEMTEAEKRAFRKLDAAITANPGALTPGQLRLYRKLLDKQVSELILAMKRSGPADRAGSFDWRV